MDARQQNIGKVCSVEGCGRSAVAKGLCKPHYDMQRAHGRTDYVPVLMNTTRCLAVGCQDLARQKGLCDRHYQRLRKYGDPNHVPAKVSDGPCKVAGCTKQATSRGLCPAHYKAMQRHGDPTVRKNNSVRRPCAVDGCGSLTTRTYCNAHEKRFKRYGDASYKPPKVSDALCSVEGCDRQAYIGTLCRPHHRAAQRPDCAPAPAMLTAADVTFLQENRNVIPVEDLARLVGADVHTVIAVQAGRNWGRLASGSKTPAKAPLDRPKVRRTT